MVASSARSPDGISESAIAMSSELCKVFFFFFFPRF